jgi:hypothetical protein
MARVLIQDNPIEPILATYPLGSVAAIGATLGILFWGLSAWVNYYIVDQVLCRSSTTLSACLNATNLSGSIATIIIGIIGVGLLVRFRFQHPLIIALASAAVLWSLADWTAGLSWIETAILTVIMYVLTYALFAWLSRYKHLVPALFAFALAIVVVRLIVIS